MEYENPKIPEGINVTTENPLKDFVILAVGIVVSVCAMVIVLAWSSEYFVRFIPFSFERSVVEGTSLIERFSPKSVPRDAEIATYLNSLTERLADAADLPSGMSITAHYVNDETVNAYATLGGHIFILRGLLERMPNENALAMVVAHEIAHIKSRDPIVAMARGLSVALVLSSLTGISNSSLAGEMISQAGLLTTLKFSREQEIAADDVALNVLEKVYGHVHGAAVLFEILHEESSVAVPEFFASHPRSERRISTVAARASDAAHHPLTPLPSMWGPD